MKAIKCTKKQFEEFKKEFTKPNSGKKLYHQMMNHFNRVSPWRYEVMKNAYDTMDHKWLYKVLELDDLTYLSNQYMLKFSNSRPNTIDGCRYIYISLELGNYHINNVINASGYKSSKKFVLSVIFDFLNTYLNLYNL